MSESGCRDLAQSTNQCAFERHRPPEDCGLCNARCAGRASVWGLSLLQQLTSSSLSWLIGCYQSCCASEHRIWEVLFLESRSNVRLMVCLKGKSVEATILCREGRLNNQKLPTNEEHAQFPYTREVHCPFCIVIETHKEKGCIYNNCGNHALI